MISALYLVGGIPTPLKNMSSSVGMMTFPIYGKSKKIHGSKPPTRYPMISPFSLVQIEHVSVTSWSLESFGTSPVPNPCPPWICDSFDLMHHDVSIHQKIDPSIRWKKLLAITTGCPRHSRHCPRVRRDPVDARNQQLVTGIPKGHWIMGYYKGMFTIYQLVPDFATIHCMNL